MFNIYQFYFISLFTAYWCNSINIYLWLMRLYNLLMKQQNDAVELERRTEERQRAFLLADHDSSDEESIGGDSDNGGDIESAALEKLLLEGGDLGELKLQEKLRELKLKAASGVSTEKISASSTSGKKKKKGNKKTVDSNKGPVKLGATVFRMSKNSGEEEDMNDNADDAEEGDDSNDDEEDVMFGCEICKYVSDDRASWQCFILYIKKNLQFLGATS